MSQRQAQALEVIKQYRKEKGYDPSFREIAEAMGVSIPTVQGYITALQLDGVLKKVRYRRIYKITAC